MRRQRLIKQAVRQRFAVTLRNNEGTFAGVLTQTDPTTWVFEQCSTIPKQPGETPEPISGRIFVDRGQVAYLQELPA
jgi:small nuclear ribonucleoprotein (snRNP)-like protein